MPGGSLSAPRVTAIDTLIIGSVARARVSLASPVTMSSGQTLSLFSGNPSEIGGGAQSYLNGDGDPTAVTASGQFVQAAYLDATSTPLLPNTGYDLRWYDGTALVSSATIIATAPLAALDTGGASLTAPATRPSAVTELRAEVAPWVADASAAVWSTLQSAVAASATVDLSDLTAKSYVRWKVLFPISSGGDSSGTSDGYAASNALVYEPPTTELPEGATGAALLMLF